VFQFFQVVACVLQKIEEVRVLRVRYYHKMYLNTPYATRTKNTVEVKPRNARPYYYPYTQPPVKQPEPPYEQPQRADVYSSPVEQPEPQYQQPQRADVSQTILNFGKYKGKTYDSIKKTDVAYCNWILKQMNAGRTMLDFQQWLKENGRKVACECCNGSGLVDAV